MTDGSAAHFYGGDELETMGLMANYRKWILSLSRKPVAGRVLEIGAGIGSFTGDFLRDSAITEMVVIEPDARLAETLRRRLGPDPRLHVIVAPVERALAALPEGHFDAIVMINVLEHIEDDVAALAGLRDKLRSGGTFYVFVPALQWLYSDLDRKIGHFRRYARDMLAERARTAGYRVLDCRYADVIGTLPWLFFNKWLGATTIKPGFARTYDAIFVPVGRTIEGVVAPPFGKNLAITLMRA